MAHSAIVSNSSLVRFSDTDYSAANLSQCLMFRAKLLQVSLLYRVHFAASISQLLWPGCLSECKTRALRSFDHEE
jgi:hypothetical protein